ncbi:LodA/GoxA family CTQ-dependent oxidase [Rhizobium ruizarguesonis]|uniref:LodA/GoxA family CTQ-dependent oxidase n=1 Tax=Rhizobium ruizarguesonis TaxID=2081791 RepID=UPI001FE0D516|nr:LodA/GoxA family CTQ-dependent oxidase [Rhizobium ruizarguesonis]
MDLDLIESIKVYPPLGIARVGNAKGSDDYFVGPEVIGGPPTMPDGTPALFVDHFRKADGSIKRQAARFRVYAHLKDGSVFEVTADDAHIEWRVAIANLKAGWYDFNQAMDLSDGLSQPALRRNRELSLPSDDRSDLDIVPTPLSISGPDAPPVTFNDGTFWRKIVPLGELRTDSKGRLLFLGGHGISAPFRKGLIPLTFANNVGWHDDISDGPVRATVTFPGAESLEAEPGYVAVTPPNYAPGVTGLVTMDDAVRETFHNEGWITKPTETIFANDIWPIFDRLTGQQWINHGLFVVHGHGSPIDARDPSVIDKLRNGSSANSSWRQSVFGLFRDPNVGADLVEPKIPQIFGDGVDTLWNPPAKPAHALGLLSVTPTQYDHLRRWAAGDFHDDWTGSIPVPPDFVSLSPLDQVAHLERAALHDCLGGPFHPGIEITWVMRLARLWVRAYRLRVLSGEKPAKQDYGPELTPAVCIGPGGPFDGVAAGALTRFMGVPWQTDGTSCNSSADYFQSTFLSMPTFWGARVPDQVLAVANYDRAARIDATKLPVQAQKHFMLRVDWLRDIRGPDYYYRLQKMVTEWAGLGMVLPVQNPPAHLPLDTRVEQGRAPDIAGSDLKIKLVTAVEELNEPEMLVQSVAHLDVVPTEPRIPPKRSFRQGEI